MNICKSMYMFTVSDWRHVHTDWISQYYYFFAIKIKINPILQCKCVMRE